MAEHTHDITDYLDEDWNSIESNSETPRGSRHENSDHKNRYTDVIPFPSTQVTLSQDRYINASFIQYTPHNTQTYIATQAPLPHTVSDFWDMVWEWGATTVVMLCRLRPHKCEQYWPDDGDELITDNLGITSSTTEESGSIEKRQLTLRAQGSERVVTHFYYKDWSDHSVPSSDESLHSLFAHTDAATAEDSPMVVHCMAGCGRTGTFCTIDTLRRLGRTTHTTGTLFDIVSRFREQRPQMVQTPSQYRFIPFFIKKFR
ncbi:MAG: protein tyrosine phosphatase [Amphiamblys sp. WSBS2006]|nr:MAG: protein tyrosine phosphatase [Amphiamblys sp. WSBS2006]